MQRSAICSHCSLVGSMPVGLCAHPACSNMISLKDRGASQGACRREAHSRQKPPGQAKR